MSLKQIAAAAAVRANRRSGSPRLTRAVTDEYLAWLSSKPDSAAAMAALEAASSGIEVLPRSVLRDAEVFYADYDDDVPDDTAPLTRREGSSTYASKLDPAGVDFAGPIKVNGAPVGGSGASPGPAHNISAPVFPKWRRALSRVRAGTADAKILCIGDSTTAGQVSAAGAANSGAFPVVLRRLLDDYYVPAADGGIWGRAQANMTDARVAVGTGWAYEGAGGFVGGWDAPAGAAGALSFTFAHTFDTITVYHLTNGGHGTSAVNVDGGASLGNIVGNAAQAVKVATFNCAPGTHTINIAGPTGGPLFILGVEASMSTTRRVHVSSAGEGATKTADWLLTGTGFQTRGASFSVYAPDLTIIALGINDAGASVPAATYEANLTSIINSVKAVGDVLLVSPIPSNGVPYTTFQPQYVEVAKALASSLNVGLLDMSARWVDYATSNALGYYSDNLHASTSGYADWAQALFNVVKTI